MPKPLSKKFVQACVASERWPKTENMHFSYGNFS